VIQAPPDAVAQGAQLPEQIQPPVDPSASQPQQGELELSPPPMDESDPGHPDYNREEKPPEEEAAPAANDAPTQKAG
jgi:hypothetical protein